MLKKILIAVVVLLLIAQVIRPEKNLSANTKNDIGTLYPIPDSVQQIIDKACVDCHSNKTAYPWYAEIQPISYWISDHVKEGKKEFNFNEFASYRIAKQNHKLEEIIEQVNEGEMPLQSYTIIHQNARLTAAEKTILTDWCKSIMDTLKANYPADSLILKRPKSVPTK